jgi:FkbM family methyltransferase
MIPENIKTRLFQSGKLRQELKKVRQLINENPESEFAKTIHKKLKNKFWFGSKRVNYYDIFTEAWSKIIPDVDPEIIEIGGLKFLNDNAFKAEYSDIFIAKFPLTNQNLEKDLIIACEVLSLLCAEGPYENEHVKIRKDDIVIDAGANMGLFSLFCIDKEIKKVYAFEPQKSALSILQKNISLNNAVNLIEPVPLGVSDKTDNYELLHSNSGHVAASIILKRNDDNDSETIHCVDLDSWVIKNNIPRIDFIKADIEGAERNMIVGATQILRDFTPRLAICTYHLPDDPVVLEGLILKANPHYVVNHTSHKLFAYVP